MYQLLLDENLLKKLKYRFGEGFHVVTVPEQGWASLQNGALLKAMSETGIEFLVTADKNMKYQQNYKALNIKLIVLNTPNLLYETLLPFIAKIKELFEQNAVQDFNWVEL